MADLPILFSAPMVRALIAGTKTQTRRLAPAPRFDPDGCHNANMGARNNWFDYWASNRAETHRFKTKFAVGDRLYVREHWRVSQRWNGTAPRDLPARTMTVFFAAGGSISNNGDPVAWRPEPWPDAGLWLFLAGKHRQAMHMPRWASRITLIVDDVKVERLQDISEPDARAEGIIELQRKGWLNGCRLYGLDEGAGHDTAVGAFNRLWLEINGDGSWAANPWVVAYTFRRVMGNIDELPKAAA